MINLRITLTMLVAGLTFAIVQTASAHTECDDQCEADAVVLFEMCVDDLGPDATEADIDVCKDESRTFRDTCRAACPDDPDDPDDCRDQCQEVAAMAFEDCVLLLGDNPTEDEIDVCEDEARVIRDDCEALCPVDCHDQCSIDAEVVLNDCLALLGEDPTDEEEDACKDEARLFRDTCREACPLDCNDQCKADADQLFADCVDALGPDPTQNDIDLCEDDADLFRDECRAFCPVDPDDEEDCRDQCKALAAIAFEDCVLLLGDNPTEDEIDVCEDESKVIRDNCEVDCPIDCDDQCKKDARQFFEDCLAGLDPDATEEDEDACKDIARDQRELCRANCDIAPLMKQHRGTGKSRRHGR